MADVIEQFAGEWRFLSNFHPVPVVYRGVTYPTVEHAFQAAKTLDLRMREEIRRASTPAVAKRLGRTVRRRPGWDGMKLGIMRYLCEQKFVDYPTMKKALLSTEDAELVEGNYWFDTYWGVCGGKGENHLGRILMAIRDDIRKGTV